MASLRHCPDQPCTLPPDLFNTYLSYKQSTKTVVEWLSKYGADGNSDCRPSVSIRTLYRYSERVRDKKIEIQPFFMSIFRVMIESRTRLGTFFKRSAGLETEVVQNASHEHFTARYLTKLSYVQPS